MLYELVRGNIELSPKVYIRDPQHFSLSEKDIENFLQSHLAEILSEDELMLIGQERKWKEEADLLALDKDGNLYIFELKRWKSDEENILQVMRYGQIFGRYSYEKLEGLAQRHEKLEGSLQTKHAEHFGLEGDDVIEKTKFNQKQNFVLVTHGVDDDTISAVEYWSKMGVNITCSPYRLYDIDGKPYIYFDTFNPSGDVVRELNPGFFIVNTNITWMASAWKDMLGDMKKGKAAAYYGRKGTICNISKNNTVYLYHTGIGVIAKGTATDNYRKTNFGNDPEEEFYVPLDFDWAVPQEEWGKKAVRPSEINSRLNTGHRFRQTTFAVSEQMAKVIDEIAKGKRVAA